MLGHFLEGLLEVAEELSLRNLIDVISKELGQIMHLVSVNTITGIPFESVEESLNHVKLWSIRAGSHFDAS